VPTPDLDAPFLLFVFGDWVARQRPEVVVAGAPGRRQDSQQQAPSDGAYGQLQGGFGRPPCYGEVDLTVGHQWAQDHADRQADESYQVIARSVERLSASQVRVDQQRGESERDPFNQPEDQGFHSNRRHRGEQ
jgi:hypothetical protein